MFQNSIFETVKKNQFDIEDADQNYILFVNGIFIFFM